MDKALPTEDTESGELVGNFRTTVVCAKLTDIHIYSQMEYEHDFLENLLYKSLFLLFINISNSFTHLSISVTCKICLIFAIIFNY